VSQKIALSGRSAADARLKCSAAETTFSRREFCTCLSSSVVVAVAVIVAFVVCWAPFHAQRLMTVYISDDQWTPQLLRVESHLFYLSG